MNLRWHLITLLILFIELITKKCKSNAQLFLLCIFVRKLLQKNPFVYGVSVNLTFRYAQRVVSQQKDAQIKKNLQQASWISPFRDHFFRIVHKCVQSRKKKLSSCVHKRLPFLFLSTVDNFVDVCVLYWKREKTRCKNIWLCIHNKDGTAD